jgi:hypothetical protein
MDTDAGGAYSSMGPGDENTPYVHPPRTLGGAYSDLPFDANRIKQDSGGR